MATDLTNALEESIKDAELMKFVLRHCTCQLFELEDYPIGTPGEIMPQTDDEVENGPWRDQWAYLDWEAEEDGGLYARWTYAGPRFEDAVEGLRQLHKEALVA